ncbi:MAG: YybH family protein [Ktedonobacterales bacterium]
MDRDLDTIPQLFYQALAQVMQGNFTPMLALWSEQEDVSYVDPKGHPYRGHDALRTYWQRAAEQNSEAPGTISATADLIMLHASDSLIATLMAEHIQVRQPDRQLLRMEAVSTNIYRREGERWRMIHRHSGSTASEE